MLSLGLTAAIQQAFHATLATSHSIKIRVQVLDLEHRAITDLSDQFIGGQVDVDAAAMPSRTASLTFTDPDRSVGFDSASPDKAALFMNRMIRIYYCVKGPPIGDWVSVPIFTGPVTALSRDGDALQVTCSGKEVLAMGLAWYPTSFPAGESKEFAVRAMLAATGERHFDFMALSERLGSAVALAPESIPWDVVRSVIAGGDRQLFYDGRGVCRLRKYPSATQFTFRTGEGGALTSAPSISYDYENMRNSVLVKGPPPAGSKTPIRGSAQALPSHPLSPVKLGRNGSRRYLVEVVEKDTLRSNGEATALATNTLASLLDESIDVQFDSLVIPHLEPGDLIRLQTEDFALTNRVQTFTIPLVAAETMSIGYQRRVSTGPRQYAAWVAQPAKRSSRVLKAPRKKKKAKR